MRIAYVCADPGVPVFGRKGCSIHVQEVVRALRARGATVELFATRFDGDAPRDMDARLIHKLPDLPGDGLAAREQAALAANRETTAALARECPFDMIYERYSLWSYAGMEYARATGVPGSLEVNAPLVEEQATHRGLVDRAGAERVAERVFNAATSLLAVSEEVAAHLGRYGAARGRIHIVPNGVDPERFPANIEPALPGPPGAFTVGFVGTLKPWHGLPSLVEAFDLLHRRDQNARLLVVGDGPERQRLVRELSARGLRWSAHLTGAVAPEEVPGLLASMDVAVAPYPNRVDFYFSPLKVYEYMAAGVPVVAGRLGQLTKLIRDGLNGFLYPPDDTNALAMALNRLREDCDLRARVGRAARETITRDHTWDAVARRILEIAGIERQTQNEASGDQLLCGVRS